MNLKEKDQNLIKINEIFSNISFVDEPKISFPQADNINRLICICKVLNEKLLSKDEVTELNGFAPRQSDYYINAGIYLGLIEKFNNNYVVKFRLTPKGKYIFNLKDNDRNLELTRLILMHTVFYNVFEVYLDGGIMPSRNDIVVIMKQHNLYNIKSDETYKRRSLTISSWIQWIIKLFD